MENVKRVVTDNGVELTLGIHIDPELYNLFPVPSFKYWIIGFQEVDGISHKVVDEGGILPILPKSLMDLKNRLGALKVEKALREQFPWGLMDLLYFTDFSSEVAMHDRFPVSHKGWMIMGATSFLDGSPKLPWVYNIHTGEIKECEPAEWWIPTVLDIMGSIYTNKDRVFTKGFEGGIEPFVDDPKFYLKIYYPQAFLFQALQNLLEVGGYKLPEIYPMILR